MLISTFTIGAYVFLGLTYSPSAKVEIQKEEFIDSGSVAIYLCRDFSCELVSQIKLCEVALTAWSSAMVTASHQGGWSYGS
jgi:hypothetical protein